MKLQDEVILLCYTCRFQEYSAAGSIQCFMMVLGWNVKSMVEAYKWGQTVIPDKQTTSEENSSMHLMGCELGSCSGHYESARATQLPVHSIALSERGNELPERIKPGLNQASVYNFQCTGNLGDRGAC